jgi:predicted ATPase
VRLRRLSYHGIPSLGTAELSFSSPLTVLSGPNGVGKTTLLRALWATLDPEGAAQVISGDRKLTAGSCLAELLTDEGEAVAEVEFSADRIRRLRKVKAAVVHIDSGSDALSNQAEFCRFASMEELTNGVGPRELDAEELAELNYLLHREHRSVTLFEVEMGGTAPFFEVAYGEDRYDSRTMGAGEAAAFFLWWKLRDLDAGTIVLIEEPEAFLSFACQESLTGYLVSLVVQKHLCLVMSSHSAPLITSMSQENLQFLVRGRKGLQIISDKAPPILLKSMGINPPIAGVVFVEDAAAAAFLKSILERLDPALSRRLSIDVRGGDGEIVAALTLTKSLQTPLRFVGAFDPDMNGRIPAKVAEHSMSLPGNDAVEVMFRNMVSANSEPLAAATERPNMDAILAALEGANHHDWYEELCRELGLTKAQLFPTLFNIWMRDERNEAAVTEAYGFLVNLLEADVLQ